MPRPGGECRISEVSYLNGGSSVITCGILDFLQTLTAYIRGLCYVHIQISMTISSFHGILSMHLSYPVGEIKFSALCIY